MGFFYPMGLWRVDQLRGWDICSSLQTRTFRVMIRLGCRRRPSLYPSIASVVRFLLGSSHVRGNYGPNLCFSAGRHYSSMTLTTALLKRSRCCDEEVFMRVLVLCLSVNSAGGLLGSSSKQRHHNTPPLSFRVLYCCDSVVTQ